MSKQEVRRIARLARLRFSEEETERLAEEMGRILDYMQQLRVPDTAGVPPMTHGLEQPQMLHEQMLREDEPEAPLPRNEAHQQASEAEEDGHFRVPQTVR